MFSKRFPRLLITSFFTLSILVSIIAASYSFSTFQRPGEVFTKANEKFDNPVLSLIGEIRIPKSISQDDNTTDIINATTTDTTETEETNTTESDKTLVPWNPIIGEDTYYPLALIFSVLGILSTLWLVFFVETSRDRTIRERIIGSTIRLILMSLFLGIAMHFWILFDPI